MEFANIIYKVEDGIATIQPSNWSRAKGFRSLI